ncbi:hypothetical protein [Micromonospora sp. NBRC 101691]|uniref:hypothetical protein n=1 Tax=Micromonospora sp. NBRC 101691 TaxID=3032198 RepID=UPI0024A52B8A|nr:hypothetical protein [Micromonospora sp. NBRC 101691]GLY21706.1 hypothetical protein Misp04_14380 [Micromonospora sp. NBRC 101691]
MSVPISLTVVLRTGRAAQPVTVDIRDLTFRWTDPGGYASCTISLDRPLAVQPDEIAYYGLLTVYDARDGSTVWEGRLEDPGRSAGGNGQVWALTAVGGQAHTRDRTVPLVYVDTSLNRLRRIDNFTPGGQDSVTTDPEGRQALFLRFPSGTAVVVDSRVVMRYQDITDVGMRIARVAFSWDTGLTSAGLAVQAIMSTTGVGTADTAFSATANTAGGNAVALLGTHFGVGRDRVDLRWLDVSVVGTVSQETWWASFYNVAVRALLKDKLGNDITSPTSYTANTVLASEVVADLLGRVLTDYDGAASTIAATSYPIDQLAYVDGADAAKVLGDLVALEPTYTWRVWERTTSGRWRFEWVARPTAVRYEADLTDGYDSQGSADGLYNAVTVRWREPSGRTRTTVRTSTVPALTAAGLTRQASIDLGSEVGSATAAAQAGDKFLAEHQYPPNAGSLRIARPILDLQTGRMVQPWEIRPGLIRVRGILPRIDGLNATDRDGVTVFRIVSSEYRASDAAATLELDSYARTVPRMVADLMRTMSSARAR